MFNEVKVVSSKKWGDVISASDFQGIQGKRDWNLS